MRAMEDSVRVKSFILNDNAFIDRLSSAVEVCVNSLKTGGRIWFAGNGGSAADAQHLAAELSGRFYLDRNDSAVKHTFSNVASVCRLMSASSTGNKSNLAV